MLSVSRLNALRREALEKIEGLRAQPHTYNYTEPKAPDIRAISLPQSPEIRARCSKNQLSRELIRICGRLIIPPDAIDTALALGADSDRIIVEIPRILFEAEEKIPDRLAHARSRGITAAWCGNIGAIHIARAAGMEIHGGWSLNITNSEALLAMREMVAKDTELSFEVSARRLGHIVSEIPFGILAYGYLPLMAYRNCPMRAAVGCEKCGGHGELCDRTGTAFAVSCRDGVSELFNSVPLWLADRLREVPAHFHTLWFTHESASQCRIIAAQYAGTLPAQPPEKYTRGLYYRPVQ